MERKPETAPASSNPERGPAVLLVDDDPALLQLLEFFLERKGLEVTTTSDGTEALALARRAIPDLIVTDLMLPVMGGRELREHLLADPRTAHIPVLLLTAAPSPQPEGTFAEVITKPFALDDLFERIQRHIR